MSVSYHKNAKTNIHIRQEIKKSSESFSDLAKKYNITVKTVSKWKKRDDPNDLPSSHKTRRTKLSELEEWVICEIRTLFLFSLDEMVAIFIEFIPFINRDIIYRCLKRNNLNNLKNIQKNIADTKDVKPFKEYDPGYIHIDVKYLPKLLSEPNKQYLFVAIDRATRYAYISIKEHKSAECAEEFLKEVLELFPYKIHKILTDNGTEFTDKFQTNNNKPSGNHYVDIICKDNSIEHRLSTPYKPQTNGMIERYNRRVEEILANNKFENYDILMKALQGYLKCYNNWIKQRALKYRAPVEVMKDYYMKKKEVFKDNFDISKYNETQPYN